MLVEVGGYELTIAKHMEIYSAEWDVYSSFDSTQRGSNHPDAFDLLYYGYNVDDPYGVEKERWLEQIQKYLITPGGGGR